MHPRDMFLAEKGALAMDSVDHEFALEWYRRGVMAEREECAKLAESLTSMERAWRRPGPLGECAIARAIRERSNASGKPTPREAD